MNATNETKARLELALPAHAVKELHKLRAAIEAMAEFAIAGRDMPDAALDRCEWYADQFGKIRDTARKALAL